MWPNGRRLRISWDKQFEHMLRMSGQGVSRMLDFSRQRLPGRGLLAIFFPDAVRATSFAGVAPAPFRFATNMVLTKMAPGGGRLSTSFPIC